MVTAVTQFHRTPIVEEVTDVQIVLEVEGDGVTGAYADDPIEVLVVNHDTEEVETLTVYPLDALPNVTRRLIAAAEEEED